MGVTFCHLFLVVGVACGHVTLAVGVACCHMTHSSVQQTAEFIGKGCMLVGKSQLRIFLLGLKKSALLTVNGCWLTEVKKIKCDAGFCHRVVADVTIFCSR